MEEPEQGENQVAPGTAGPVRAFVLIQKNKGTAVLQATASACPVWLEVSRTLCNQAVQTGNGHSRGGRR